MTTNDLVVGIDDSAPSRAALRWAADYARRSGLRLRVLHLLAWPLVVGEHTGLSRLVSGSTAHYCLNHATCPVVTVPGGDGATTRRRAGRDEHSRLIGGQEVAHAIALTRGGRAPPG
jgi:nucleotide-binding universal stress UspA family protein